jgi:hypothetical protein
MDGPHSLYTKGLAQLTNKLIIGSDRKKAHIYVPELKPREFLVVKQGDEVRILDMERGGSPRGTFRTTPSDVRTSTTEIRLRVGLDSSKLRC